MLSANYKLIFVDINRFINHLYTLRLIKLAKEDALIKS